MSEETVSRSANGPPLGVPSHVGRYEVRGTLGNGTFGRVYLAFDPEIERLVAVKVPLLPPESQRAFLREARVIADIHHPHVCPVYDAGTHDGLPFIVTRYVKGGTLEQLLGRDLPTTAEALRYAEQIARGLDAAHARGVIHRDLKPANVLYDEVARELVLTDFGIARWLESATATSGGIKGTPLYMAPEQWEPGGQFGDISARTDVYSLGVVLFRLLTGAHLFAGGTIQQMIGHCTTPPRKPSAVRPALAPRHDTLCLRALAKRPTERYASAHEFVAAIADCLRPAAVPAAPKPAPPPKPVARRGGDVVEFPLPGRLKMPFCWIPPGTAQLGSPPAEQHAVAEQLGERPNWLADESEARRGLFTTKGFWLAKYPVTQAEWHALTGEAPSYFRADGGAVEVKGLDTTRFPVENVSWDTICGTDGFLNRLGARGGLEQAFGAGARFALPHEDMWEYACRGGLSNRQPFYFGKEITGARANFNGNSPFGTAAKGPSPGRTTTVGSYAAKAPHPWGLCDTHGNVWEWCENAYNRTTSRVLRGGSWYHEGYYCRAASRSSFAPDRGGRIIGIRLAVSEF